MTGPGPKQEGAALVVESNEDYSLILEALEELKANGSYRGRMLATTALGAFEKVRADFYYAEKNAADLIDRLTRERDALEQDNATMKKSLERNLLGALGVLHGGRVKIEKLEVNSQPAEKV